MGENISKQDIILNTIAHEGGYVNDPDDLGGETNMGITHITWVKYGDGTPLKDIVIEQAMKVYDIQFYQKQLIDEVALIYPSLANNFFDASVNCGRCGATRILQQLINGYAKEFGWESVEEDGYIGTQTLTGLTRVAFKIDDDEIENDWRTALHGYYKSIVKNNPKLRKYLKGWHNRLMEVY